MNEAAFLARSSGLTFYASSLRVRGEAQLTMTPDVLNWGTNATSVTNLDTRDYDVRYQFVAPEKSWIGIVSGGQVLQDVSGYRARHIKYSVGLGRYIGPRTSVLAEYGRSYLHTGFGEFRDETLTVGVHSLLRLGTRRYLGVTAALDQTKPIDGPAVNTYQIGVAYYPRSDISIGLSTTGDYHNGSFAPNGNEDNRGYVLEASWFLTDSIALGLGYETNIDRSRFSDVTFGSSYATKNAADGFRFNVSWRH